MGDNIKVKVSDDLSDMIEKHTEKTSRHSPEEMQQALRTLASSEDESRSGDPWIARYHDLPSYKLEVVRDGSDEYFMALADAITAATRGEYGSIDYRGYKIYYTDTPRIRSICLDDGHKEYSCEITFQCEALSAFNTEEYHSEEERHAYLDTENDLFSKTVALLDKEIEMLDNGTWIREKKTLNIYDFKDYSPEESRFERITWEDRNKDAAGTLLYLLDDAALRRKELKYTEDDFSVFADVIRRMVFFADYGKRNYLFELEGLIWYEWKPQTKRDRYIWRCMNEFGQGDLPDNLLDNCALYYFLDDPKGWEALAYILPIVALEEMCQDYEPDNVKDALLKVFELIPGSGYRERVEKLIAQDRAKADEGGSEK